MIAAGQVPAVLPREEPGVVPGSDARLGAGSRDVSGAAPSAPGAHPVGDRASDSLRRLRRTVWPSGPRADLGWPRGLALHPHGLGQHPRQNARKRTRTGHPLRPGSIVEVRGRYLGGPPVIKNGSASRPLRLHGPALPRSACAARLHTTWPRASPGATRSGVALGLFPAGRHPRPLPLAPRRAGSLAHARNLGPANAPAAPQNYPASGGRLLAWGLGTTPPPSLG
jgi:hypothetical protein